MTRMQMVGVRVGPELREALEEKARKEDRSMAYVAREALEKALLGKSSKKRRAPVPKASPYTTLFERFWDVWRRSEFRLKAESKKKAAEQWEGILRLQPPHQHDRFGHLLERCAEEQDRVKKKARESAEFAPNFPHLERWLRDRIYQDTDAWRTAERRRAGATTGATAPSPAISTDEPDGISEPFDPTPPQAIRG